MVGSEWVLQECLEQCKADLCAWNAIEFGHVGRNIMELQTKLEWLEVQPGSKEIMEALRHTRTVGWIERMTCGDNDQGLIGSKMVIGIQVSFMPRPWQDIGRILWMVY